MHLAVLFFSLSEVLDSHYLESPVLSFLISPKGVWGTKRLKAKYTFHSEQHELGKHILCIWDCSRGRYHIELIIKCLYTFPLTFSLFCIYCQNELSFIIFYEMTITLNIINTDSALTICQVLCKAIYTDYLINHNKIL